MCIYVCVYTYVYICICVYMYVYTHMCIYVYVYTYVHICVYTHIYYFSFFFHICYYKILSKVPSATNRSLLFVYFI